MEDEIRTLLDKLNIKYQSVFLDTPQIKRSSRSSNCYVNVFIKLEDHTISSKVDTYEEYLTLLKHMPIFLPMIINHLSLDTKTIPPRTLTKLSNRVIDREKYREFSRSWNYWIEISIKHNSDPSNLYKFYHYNLSDSFITVRDDDYPHEDNYILGNGLTLIRELYSAEPIVYFKSIEDLPTLEEIK